MYINSSNREHEVKIKKNIPLTQKQHKNFSNILNYNFE